jgi:hypothetical protein
LLKEFKYWPIVSSFQQDILKLGAESQWLFQSRLGTLNSIPTTKASQENQHESS